MVRAELPFNTKNYCTKLVSVYDDDISPLRLRPLNILWNEGIKSNIMNPPPPLITKVQRCREGKGLPVEGVGEIFERAPKGASQKVV
jgi:hypothetical protein